MFDKATRMKLRFETPRGFVSTEDLWDLPLTATNGMSLDDIARNLDEQITKSGKTSFVVKNKKPNKRLTLAFDIVKHVIDVKLVEADKAKKAAEVKQAREKIMSIMADKQDAQLQNKSLKALEDMLNKLNDEVDEEEGE